MLHSELSLHGLKLILVLLEQLQSQSEASVESESESESVDLLNLRPRQKTPDLGTQGR